MVAVVLSVPYVQVTETVPLRADPVLAETLPPGAHEGQDIDTCEAVPVPESLYEEDADCEYVVVLEIPVDVPPNVNDAETVPERFTAV